MKRTILKKLTACLCLCAVLSGALTVPAGAASFQDVPSNHWAATAIDRCAAQGWFQGKTADTFGVGQPMTRAGFAVALSRFFGWQSGETYYRIFSDVPQGAWYEPALRACYEHGAVTRQTGVLKSTAAAATAVAEALTDSSYDGVYLNITPSAENGDALAAFVQALRAAVPEKKLYVAASAPARREAIPDYQALGKAADRIVLQVSGHEDTDGAVPVYAMEPLETVYYALSALNDQIPGEKLALLLTAEGHGRKGTGKPTAFSGDAVAALEVQGRAYYSDRYACAYVEAGDTTAWYLDGRALDARRQLLNCFGVNSLCLSTLNGTLNPTEN